MSKFRLVTLAVLWAAFFTLIITYGLGLFLHKNTQENSYITLYSEIDQKVSDKIIKDIASMQDGTNDPIYLYINSPGGEVFEGLRIIDAMQTSHRPVITVDVGMASSMAGYIFFYGKERWMTKHAIIMLHNVSGLDSPQQQILQNRFNLVANIVKELNQNIVDHSDATLTELLSKENYEWWIQSPEALQRKFVDKIVILFPPNKS